MPGTPAYEAFRTEYLPLEVRQITALQRLFLTPAPDPAAFALKTHLFEQEGMLDGVEDAGEAFHAIVSDALRLMRGHG